MYTWKVITRTVHAYMHVYAWNTCRCTTTLMPMRTQTLTLDTMVDDVKSTTQLLQGPICTQNM